MKVKYAATSGVPVEAGYLYLSSLVTLALTGVRRFSFDRMIRRSSGITISIG